MVKCYLLPEYCLVTTVCFCWHMQRGSETQAKFSKAVQSKDEEDEGLEEEDEEEHGETLCGACGENYAADEFWICCDVCEKWFHGKCVKITPARAEHIKQYKCPSCSNKRARPWWWWDWRLCILAFIWTSNCLLGLFLIRLCLGSVGCCVGWKFAIYLVIN